MEKTDPVTVQQTPGSQKPKGVHPQLLWEFIKYRNESVFRCGKVHVSTGLYMPAQTIRTWDTVRVTFREMNHQISLESYQML